MTEESKAGYHETSESVDAGHHGKKFEYEMSKFVFKRLLDKGFEDFKFTREKRGLGKFDDLAYVYETKDGQKRFSLMQFKHLQNDNETINYEKLATDKSSYFLLPKYFQHYLESKKAIDADEDFADANLESLIICTNISFGNDMGDLRVCDVKNESDLFQNSKDVVRLELSNEKKREIFHESYLSECKKLANELIRYSMLKKKIDVNVLEKDAHVSMVLKYHEALAKHVIDESSKTLKQSFIKGKSNISGVDELRKCLMESFMEFCSKYENYDDDDLRKAFSFKTSRDANALREKISTYKSEQIENFLQELTIDVTSIFGDSSHSESKKRLSEDNDVLQILMRERELLADEVIRYAVLSKVTDDNTLKTDNVNMILKYRAVLTEHVFNVEEKKLKKNFIEGKSKDSEVNEFRKCLLESFSEFYSKYKDGKDEELRNIFKLNKSGVNGLKNMFSEYELRASEHFLTKFEVIMGRNFGKSVIFSKYGKDSKDTLIERERVTKKLTNELAKYIMLNWEIDVETLRKEYCINDVLKEHIALAEHVIDVKDRKLKPSFLYSQLPEIKAFRKCLVESFSEFRSKYRESADDDLRKIFKLDESGVSDLRNNLYESKDEKFLETLTVNVTQQFGEISLPEDAREPPESVDRNIDSFLSKLIFGLNQININSILQKEFGNESINNAFNENMSKWYDGCDGYLKSDTSDKKRKIRKWLTKQDLVEAAKESNVLFQGQEVKLHQLITDHKMLNSDTLIRAFCGLDLIIGNKPTGLGEIQHYYINRFLVITERQISENAFYTDEDPQNCFLIAAEPGMGKSTLVTNIAQYLVRNSHEKGCPDWVITILLRNVAECLEEIEDFRNLDNVINFISKFANASSEFEKKLLTHFLKNDRIVLILDGFDELYAEKYRGKIIDFFRHLRRTGWVKKLFVTTRLHFKNQLENCLGVPSYSFEKISRDEQIFFLTRYWKEKSNISEKNIEEFSQNLIDKMYNSFSNKERSFLGIPLHTYMLAVIFLEEAKKENPVFLESLNLTSLFERFVRTKYEIYIEQKCGDKIKINPKRYEKEMKFYDVCHQNQALINESLILPEYVASFVTEDKTDTTIEALLDIGIIFHTNGKKEFIHRTFGEYFFAMRFVDVALNITEYSAEHRRRLEDFLLGFGREFISYLFDLKIAETFKTAEIIIKNDIDSIEKLTNEQIDEKDSLGRGLLYYCFKYEHYATVEILIKKGISVDLHCPFFKRLYYRKVGQLQLKPSSENMIILKKLAADVVQRSVTEIGFCFTETFNIQEEIEAKNWKVVEAILKYGLYLTDLSKSLYKYAKQNLPVAIVIIPKGAPSGNIKVALEFKVIIAHLQTLESNQVTDFLSEHRDDFCRFIRKSSDDEFHHTVLNFLKRPSLFANLDASRKKPVAFFENCFKTLPPIFTFLMEIGAFLFYFHSLSNHSFLKWLSFPSLLDNDFILAESQKFLRKAGFKNMEDTFANLDVSHLEERTKDIYDDVAAAVKRYEKEMTEFMKKASLLIVLAELLNVIITKNISDLLDLRKMYDEVHVAIFKKDFPKVKKVLGEVEKRGWMKAFLNVNKATNIDLQNWAKEESTKEITQYITQVSRELEDKEQMKKKKKKTCFLKELIKRKQKKVKEKLEKKS